MTLSLSDKEARRLGLVDADAPRQKRGRKAQQNMPATACQKPVALREEQSAAHGS